MKLAISNIAWKRHDDPHILKYLGSKEVTGIEIAPTKVWPGWEGANQKNAAAYRKKMQGEGFEIPAVQAILFGKPELQFFNPRSHESLLEHMKRVTDLAAGLGAKVIVLGAPKNRRRGALSMQEAYRMIEGLMVKIGNLCQGRGGCLGIEPNPVEYGCDFLTSTAEARDFVDKIDHPGVRLHLDSGCIDLSGEEISKTISAAFPFAHYHISEPMLAPVSKGVVDHRKALKTLRDLDYSGYASIEMKEPAAPEELFSSVNKICRLFEEIWKE